MRNFATAKNEEYNNGYIAADWNTVGGCLGDGFQTVIHSEREIWKISQYSYM